MKHLLRRFNILRSSLRQWWSQRDPQTLLLMVYMRRAVANYARYDARRAAALAYYTVFSIFPLTLLLAIGISQVLGTAVAQEQIGNALNLFIPETGITDLLLSNINQAMRQTTSFGLVAFVGLAWAGLGVFTNVTSALDLIFNVPHNRSLWRQRLVALVMVVILVVLITTSFLASGVISLLSLLFINGSSTWLIIASIFLPLGLNMMIFLLLFRYVPARPVHWDAIWPAAILGSAGFELARRAFSWYLANLANFQVIYGSITAVIVLLFWAYLLASVFLFSAELCAQMNEWLEARSDDDPLDHLSPSLGPGDRPELP
jgi:membrane protein